MSRADAVLTWMAAWEGYEETPVNIQVFAKMVGHQNGRAWCATGRVAAHRSTSTPIPDGGDSPYTPANWAAYRRAGLLVPHADVEPGDLGWVGYKAMEGQRPHGIGHEITVRDVLDGRTITTWEFNGGQDGSRSGGKVASLTRDIYDRGSARMVAFARPRWDGTPPPLVNLPVKATHTGQFVFGDALSQIPRQLRADGHLAVNGRLDTETITRWQQVMGTTLDGVISTGPKGSALVKAVQRYLNARLGTKLIEDGKGITQDGRRYRTVGALQAYLGTVQDERMDAPVSVVVMRLQERLNTGRF